MPIELHYAGNSFLEIHTHVAVEGKPAFGTYKLIFSFNIGVAAREAGSTVELLSIYGRVDVNEKELGWLLPDTRAALASATSYRTVPLSLAMRLSSEQLESLVRETPNGLASCRINFVGIAKGPQGIFEIFGNGLCDIDRDQWQAALEQCGYADTFNIWVQVPRNAMEQYRNAAAALKEAQAHHRAGRFADAIAKCRIAVEKMYPHARRFDFKNHEVKTITDRIACLNASIFKFCCEPHHEIAEDYGAIESRLALALAASALEYANGSK